MLECPKWQIWLRGKFLTLCFKTHLQCKKKKRMLFIYLVLLQWAHRSVFSSCYCAQLVLLFIEMQESADLHAVCPSLSLDS